VLQATNPLATSGPTWFLARLLPSNENMEAILAVQGKLLEIYEGANSSWLYRVTSETELWSQLANKLTRARTVPEAVSALDQCLAYRTQMAADDGRRLSEDVQKIIQTITTPLSSGSPIRAPEAGQLQNEEGAMQSQAQYEAVATDDGRRLSEDVSKIRSAITVPLPNGSPVTAPEARQCLNDEGASRSQARCEAEHDTQWKRSLDGWGERISKLRWLGLDDEAVELQLMVRALPAQERGSVLPVGSFGTD
jgi:hypothetical protein